MSSMQFTGAVEGYVRNYLKKNQWRVQRTHSMEDSMQEANLIFWRCRVKYPDVEDKHLMALFKTAWSNHFTDLAFKCSDLNLTTPECDLARDDDAPALETRGDLDTDGMLVLMIKQAPREVQAVLALFVSAPTELLELAIDAWRLGGKRKAEGNKMVNRCLGLPDEQDSIGNVRRYFLGTD